MIQPGADVPDSGDLSSKSFPKDISRIAAGEDGRGSQSMDDMKHQQPDIRMEEIIKISEIKNNRNGEKGSFSDNTYLTSIPSILILLMYIQTWRTGHCRQH